MHFVKRPFVLVAVGIVLASAVVLGAWFVRSHTAKAAPRRVYDEASLIPAKDVLFFENYLKWIFNESDVDVRLVLLENLGGVPPEQAAVDWMQRLGVGSQGREERGVLILYDFAGQHLRVEVGYGLEEYFPDGFVGYLINDHARTFFGAGQASTGIRYMLRILQDRIRRAVLGERFDPTVLDTVRRTGPLSGGGGASARTAFGHGQRPSELGPEERARYVPQSSPEETYRLYHEWMAGDQYDPEVDMFTPQTRKYLKGRPMSRAYFNYVILGEYGKRFKTIIRGDLALLYFTNDPFLRPYFFRKRDNRWQLDVYSGLLNTVERVGCAYTWDYRGGSDAFSKTFTDKLVKIDGHRRISDGDNRQLPSRRSIPDSSRTAGWTKLHFAAAQGRADEARRLLDGGENVNVRNAMGRTPLYEAAKRGRLEAVKLLIERGATVNATESDVGFTPLHVASERKHSEVVRYLLGKGADVNARNKWKQTPLWQAAWQTWHQDAEIAGILLGSGADPNADDHQGLTPLHMAARGGHLRLADLLLRSGADANSRTANGVTPLHYAAGRNHPDIVRLLLDHHADVTADFGDGTPLQTAERMGHDEVAALLRQRGAGRWSGTPPNGAARAPRPREPAEARD